LTLHSKSVLLPTGIRRRSILVFSAINMIEIGYRKGRRKKFREKEARKGLASLCSNQYVFKNPSSVMDNRSLTKVHILIYPSFIGFLIRKNMYI